MKKEFDGSISTAKHKIKDEIRKCTITLGIKLKALYLMKFHKKRDLYILNIMQLNPK